jgi:hypothetical protein
MKRLDSVSIVASLAWLLGACAAAPPPELTAARYDVHAASGGELAAVDSIDVREARNALSEADACLERLGDADVARDLAYVAERRLERARVMARIAARIEQEQPTPATRRQHEVSAER